jgi:hypothetical protein
MNRQQAGSYKTAALAVCSFQRTKGFGEKIFGAKVA